MGASYLKQIHSFTKPHILGKVVHGDRSPTGAHGVLPISCAQPPSIPGFCSISTRITSLRLKSGLSSRIGNDAIDRSSNSKWFRMKSQAHTRRQVETLEDFSYDLYELLGVEKDTDAETIKRSYRWLQKRCHPDIAGPRGHDMAILLNDAYAVLSDPSRRANYDATCVEKAEFAGYTGEPLHSKWFGRAGEDRAVFVEETRCIGCLKCALIAKNTFAIELKYGRARAVGQWLDDEGTIQDAIRACPVDCISWVDRAFLPALEFVMSKQPRLLVGLETSSYVGVRRENVFAAADRLIRKHAQRQERQSSKTMETEAQREARVAAAEEIHVKAGRWWYDLMYRRQGFPNLTFTNIWDPTSARIAQGALIPISSIRGSGNKNQFVDNNGPETFFFDRDADIGPLLEAARQRRQGTNQSSKVHDTNAGDEEAYWSPMEPISCPLPPFIPKKSTPLSEDSSSGSELVFDPSVQWSSKMIFERTIHKSLQNIISAVPIVVSVIAAVLVGMDGGFDVARSETDVISGPLPASMTSSVVTQMFLTAVVWYMIGAVVCEGAVYMLTAFVSLRSRKDQE